MELDELASEALRHGFVFRCWEPVAGEGFTHTIDEASLMDYAERIVEETSLTYKLVRVMQRRLGAEELKVIREDPGVVWELKQDLLKELKQALKDIER